MVMEAHTRPCYFDQFGDTFEQFWQACEQAKLTLLEGAFSILNLVPEIDGCVVGCTSGAELKQLVSVFSRREQFHLDWRKLQADSPDLLLPYRWPASV